MSNHFMKKHHSMSPDQKQRPLESIDILLNYPVINTRPFFTREHLLVADPRVAAALEKSGKESSKKLVWVWTVH